MTKIETYFSKVTDPRSKYRCKHLLSDILLIVLCTYLINGEDFEDMVIFGKTKGKLLPELLQLPHRVPSHDTAAALRFVFKIFPRFCNLGNLSR